MSLTKSCNFCIHENRVFDLEGHEILPDEDGIICVFLNGMERRFKVDKMIIWLKDSGYNKLFRQPKIPKPVKVSVPEVLKPIKIPKPKKEPSLCECGSIMFGKSKCQKCRTKNKKTYVKVEVKDSKGYPKRKVSCSNGKEYSSLYDAGKKLNLTRSQIWHVCTGKWKHTHGLVFKYI